MKWGQDSADPRSGESEKVGSIVEVKQGIEGSWY